MKYKIRKDDGMDVVLPRSLVSVMQNLSDVRLRLALTLCLSDAEMGALELVSATGNRYKPSAVEKELHFLEGAGIVLPVGERAKKSSATDISRAPDIDEKNLVSREDALRLAANSDEMRSLVRLTQDILGRTLSSGDITILASLMFVDGISVEILALGIAHCAVEKKKPNLRYIEKMMKGWLEDGVSDLASAELHLERLERNQNLKQNVAAIIGVDSITYAESLLVLKWYDDFNFDDKMIKEALLFAGEKRSVRYINGILKRWHEQGLKTVKEVRAANTGSNINVVKTIAAKDDVMIKNRATVPKFRAKKE